MAAGLRMVIVRSQEGGFPMTEPPLVFLSYSRHNDRNKFISAFGEELAAAVEDDWGEPIEIFQDWRSLGWGDNWRDHIEQALARSAYFLAFVSPGYVKSEECRRELERFLEIEEAAGHSDLILPIYFIETPEWTDPDSAETPHVARLVRTLKTRQTPDFRLLRGKPLADLEVAAEIRRLAGQLTARLRRDRKAKPGSRPPPARSAHPLPDFVPASVIGREELIEGLKAILAVPRSALVALVGGPGIGKTAVAAQVARDLAGTTSPHYLAARGYPLVNAEAVLSTLAELIPDGKPAPRATPLERLDAVLEGLAGRHVLLVIDDGGDLLDERGDLRDSVLWTVLEDLAEHDGHHVQVLLVSDRPPRSGTFRVVPMTHGLPHRDFPAFLRELDPSSAVVPTSERDRLARVTRRWPRPAELVHGVAAGRRVSVTEVLDGVDRVEGADRSVRLVRSAAAGLEEHELSILRLLAACARPLPSSAITRLTGQDADDVLARLAHRRIVRRIVKGDEVSYHLPIADGWPIIEGNADLQRRAADYFQARCQDVANDARLAELGCYFDAIELYLACGADEAAMKLVQDVDEKHLARRGQTPVLMPYLERLAGTLTDTHLKMVTALMRARALVLRGDPADSIPFAKQAVELAEAGRDSHHVLIALSQVGNGYFEDGQVTEAAIWHTYVTERGVGRPGRADAFLDLAFCQLEIGTPRVARESLRAARHELDQRSEPDDDDNALRVKVQLAEAQIAFDLGESSCLRIADEARREAERIGAELDAARCNEVRAWALLRKADRRGALRAAGDAFAVAGRTGDPVLCRVTGVTLAVLHLLDDEECEAGFRAVDAAVRSSRGHPAAGALAVRGVAEFRLRRRGLAALWFDRASSLAEAAWGKEPSNYAAYEAGGLALAGLALCRERTEDERAAAVAYGEAVRLADLPGAAFRRECMLAALTGPRDVTRLPRVGEVLGL
jgi:hypothetical protein